MKTRVSPFADTAPKQATAAHAETAKNKLDALDKCPVCDLLMIPVAAAGVPAMYCTSHRVCLPQKV